MALVKLSPEILDIKGRFGGTYFSRDKSGLHQCAMKRHIHYSGEGNPLGSIHWFSGLNTFWQLVLILGFGFLWAQAAIEHYYEKNGKRYHGTGWNYFVHINMKRVGLGKEPLLKPPPTYPEPD